MSLTQRARYKQTIIDLLQSSPALTQALAAGDANADAEVAKQRIFPYRVTAFPLQEPDCCISVDIATSKSSTSSIRTHQIYIWICCNKALFPGGAYETLADTLASETDHLLNESTNFGIGRLQWEGMQLYEPTPEYYGYVLQYSASDFSRKRG